MEISTLDNVITDRGSKYAVSGGVVRSREEAKAFISGLKRDKKFAKATHNSWGLVLSDGTPLKSDDGESGAGMAILRVLEGAGERDLIIVVTRWYGGVKLGGDRFRHVTQAAGMFIEQCSHAVRSLRIK